MRDAEHRVVIEGIEVVLCGTAHPSRLVVEQFIMRQSDFRDHTAKIGVRFIERADYVHNFSIIETEAGEVLEGFDGRQTLDKLVIFGADPEHQRMLVAGFLDAQNHRVPLLPLCDHLRNEFRRILEVGNQADHRVASRLQERVKWRADMAEVPGVYDEPYVAVAAGDLSKNCHGVVTGGIVYENMFVTIAADTCHHGTDALV